MDRKEHVWAHFQGFLESADSLWEQHVHIQDGVGTFAHQLRKQKLAKSTVAGFVWGLSYSIPRQDKEWKTARQKTDGWRGWKEFVFSWYRQIRIGYSKFYNRTKSSNCTHCICLHCCDVQVSWFQVRWLQISAMTHASSEVRKRPVFLRTLCMALWSFCHRF